MQSLRSLHLVEDFYQRVLISISAKTHKTGAAPSLETPDGPHVFMNFVRGQSGC
jgi:hypothetical protein